MWLYGWHDWYLAANLKKGSLDNHLLKGLMLMVCLII